MPADDIQPSLRSFIAEKIHSVAQLELLLLLHADPGKSWTASDASRALYLSPDMTAGLLAVLEEHGFIAAGESPVSYHFSPATEELGQQVNQLAELYASRRVRVITLIHSAPIDKLRGFADAFRIKTDKKEE